ncbi:GNAT family N-acetyltransferase [Cohnella pontilimi]|uniref:GNAT family N-acetyltransferase n=1 Tax=Cohnella pontilimi TaxID=2564100 RepID=A0A4U0FBV2_9BACL|nr:GNAT family N-acetyltransferase [Cohnella pontilimi]TJY42265.1 GNAT family N-acetyltransferase [Cohnella pontilimi]
MIEFTASKAQLEDTDAVKRLLVRTAEWLKSKGSTQWSGLLHGEDYHDTAGAIRRGDVYVFHVGGVLAGTVILLQQPSAWDRDLWGDEGHEPSIYLHRLAINRELGGTGLGTRIMRWAETGIRFPGKDRIRLDCIADNPVLNRFYSGLGYEFKGTAPTGFNLYEKKL